MSGFAVLRQHLNTSSSLLEFNQPEFPRIFRERKIGSTEIPQPVEIEVPEIDRPTEYEFVPFKDGNGALFAEENLQICNAVISTGQFSVNDHYVGIEDLNILSEELKLHGDIAGVGKYLDLLRSGIKDWERTFIGPDTKPSEDCYSRLRALKRIKNSLQNWLQDQE